MPKILVIQHTPMEALGTIADALESGGHAWQYVRVFEGRAVPSEMGAAAGLVVLGGPMGAYEETKYPFLREEMRLIENALKNKRPVLGICLGAQLLAAVLGAHVRKAERAEIGWHEVALTSEAAADRLWRGIGPSFTPFHWHEDSFTLAQGAVSLGSSALTTCQAFRYGHSAYGLQFHVEVTREVITAMLKAGARSLEKAGGHPDEVTSKINTYLPALQDIAEKVFGRWSELVHESAKL
jgi:GMP synthase (glutamine-hydrolysing)